MSKQWVVFKSTNESRTKADTGGVLTADDELFLSVEAGKRYCLYAQLVVYCNSTFANQINVDVALDLNDLNTSPQSYVFYDSFWVAGMTGFQQNVQRSYAYYGALDQYVPLIDNSVGDNTSFRGGMRLHGIIESNVADVLRIRWTKVDNGLGPDAAATVYAGSFLMLRELNPC